MSRWRYAYDNFEEILSAFFLAVMISALSLQVVIRATSGGAVSWAEELSRYTFVWAVYIGASLAAKRAAHVRISAQFMLFPPKVKVFFRLLADAVWTGFNLFFAIYGLKMLAEAFEYPEISPTLGIAKAWVETIIPLAFLLISWRTVEIYIHNWHRLTEWVVEQEKMV
ncbi:MAG: TRAP transporter small permease [Planctomycetota bacterium]|jgi:TRAP-type C4-dicarboxylate transport system permease small subunit|nr:TRAP transporter small permease [Planctomycetota bacterium]